MSTVAIIPARGGSKRIPKKNIRLFAGRPIISYSIQAALDSEVFDRVIVSTDAPDIAEIARKEGADAPFLRPPELSDDHCTLFPVILHSLNWLEEQGTPATHVCCILATAPLIRVEDIRGGFRLLLEAGGYSVVSVATFPSPILRALRIEANRLQMIWPEHRMTRSQDLPEAYRDAGQFYWAYVETYRINKRFLDAGAIPLVLPRYRVQDIDTQDDWDIAELMYEALKRWRHPVE